jgi:Undecaprenyl-phosphate glucose phosphotransferase
MKRGNSARATATTLDQAIDRSRRRAEIDGESPSRRDRSVSETVVIRSVAVLDALAIFSSGAIAMSWDRSAVDWRLEGLIVLLGTLLASHFLRLAGAHRFANLADVGSSVGRALLGLLLTLAVLFAGTYVFEPVTAAGGPWVMLWFSVGAMTLIATRFLVSRQMKIWNRAGRLGEVVAIVGAGSIAQRLLRHLNGTSTGPRIFGVYDDSCQDLPPRCMGHAILGSVDDLVEQARHNAIDTVIVALPPTSEHALVETLNKLSVVPIDVRLCPSEFALRLGTIETSHIGGHVFLNVIDRPLRDWRWIAKGIEDRLLAAAILLLISPVLLAIALLVRLDSPGPILFRQKRYGFNNELIEMLKFRTMYHELSDSNAEQLTQRNDPRITRIGAFLRRTSLDELPQFLNVLRGDMSIVGPRPHALAAKAGALLYQEAVKHYDARHRVKPGITGWAQVNGWRGETSTLEQIRKRVEHDLYYIEHWSIALDLQIIARTITTGFTGRNAF